MSSALGKCIFPWYERYLVYFIIFRHLLNILAYGLSLGNPSLSVCFIFMCACFVFSIAQNALSLSLASGPSCFHRLTATNCEMPKQNESRDRAVASMRQTEALASVIFSWFVRVRPGGRERLYCFPLFTHGQGGLEALPILLCAAVVSRFAKYSIPGDLVT